MKQKEYSVIEKYMLSCMKDSAHDCQHIYRVLFYVLDLSKDYVVDKDILIAAALLHDIGREAQYKDLSIDHATYGAEMAYEFLISIGWKEDKADSVRRCISTHRYRNDNPPDSIEAKILFDSDKLDITGAVGIARTISYQGIVSEPMYSVDNDGQVLLGDKNEPSSFFKEYNFKLNKIYDVFFTDKAKKIAKDRKKITNEFYHTLYKEVDTLHKKGLNILEEELENYL